MPGEQEIQLDSDRLPTPPNIGYAVEIYQGPVVVVILLQSFLFGSVYQANVYYIPLYLQNAHQFSLIKSALVYIPFVAVQSAVSVASGFYISKLKRYGEVMWVGFGTWTL